MKLFVNIFSEAQNMNHPYLLPATRSLQLVQKAGISQCDLQSQGHVIYC